MELETINLDITDRVATITLNRPNNMNAINSGLLADVGAALDQIEGDVSVGAVVITGGQKAFAAGADIKEMTTLKGPLDAHYFAGAAQRCFRRIETLRVPVIAAVSGFAFGGGCELALSCDMRIASDTAQFALPEVNLGLMPGAGGTQRLPRLIGMGKALEMLLSGNPVSAEKALAMGLANEVVPAEELMPRTLNIAGIIASKPAVAVRLLKSVVQTGMNTDLASALDYEARCFELLFSTDDQKEGVAAFVEKRKPIFKGC